MPRASAELLRRDFELVVHSNLGGMRRRSLPRPSRRQQLGGHDEDDHAEALAEG